MAWTDQRMDDLASRMDAGFARVDADIRELRGEVRDVRGEIGTTRIELRGEIDALRSLTLRFGVAMVTGMLGMIATLVGVIVTGTLG